MIEWIIRYSIRNKLIIGILTIVLVSWGIYSLVNLPMDALPDITDNQVQVHALASALDAQDVEQMITSPLELTMANIPGVKNIRSISRFGLSVITIVFNDNVNIYRARELVFQRIQEVKDELPAGLADIKMAPIATGLGEIYHYLLQPERGYKNKYSLTELRTMEDWIVKRQLEGTPGVAEINSFGGYIKQYEVSVNPEKLRSLNITISDIFNALKNNNQNTGGAYIEKGQDAYFIRGVGLVKTLDDVRKIVIKYNKGVPVCIRDVARVDFGHAVRYGAMTEAGQGETVGGIVLMLKGSNSMEVIRNVETRMAAIQKSLPPGIVIKPFIDRSDLISRAVHTISHNLVEGGVIVIFILIMFLGNWRAGLIVASVIPLAMLFAFGMMNVFGVSGNLMSLGAIDFGMIVDGSIIVVESVVFYLHHHTGLLATGKLTQEQMDDTVFLSASKIRKSAAFGEIIILIVYLPILTLAGIEGKMFRPMAETVSFAITGALLLSLTYVPMMSAKFLSKSIRSERSLSERIMNFLQNSYSPALLFALRRKTIVIAFAVLLLVASGIIFSTLGGQFIPTLEEGDFAVEMRQMPGTSLSHTISTTLQAGDILMKNFPEVINAVSRIGVASIPTDPDPMETAMITVVLKNKKEWTSAHDISGLASKMEKALSVIPGVNFEFSQPIQQRENELMTGIKQDVAVKIYGENLSELNLLGKQAIQIISSVPGTRDVLSDNTGGLPEITVAYDRDKISEYGLTISDINKTLESAFAGGKAGTIYENDRRFDLVVRLDSTFRKSIDNVRNIYISLPNGSQIPLYVVADVKYQDGPSVISRDNTKRRIAIGFNVRNRDVESVVNDIKKELTSRLKLPPGYFITYGGQFQNLVEARRRLEFVVPLALTVIFILLFFTFSSVRETLLIFTGIPFAAVGGIFALFIRGMPFSISAGVGFIALFGVAVLNGIVLISYFNQLKKEGIYRISRQVLQGSTRRLRPVIMTAMVASLGFLPMALSTSAGAEVQRPLATVIIGGLITSTLLTLIVMPVLYSLFTGGPSGKIKSPGLLTLLIPLLMLVPFTGKGQDIKTHSSVPEPQPVTLEQAVNMALQNNPQIKSAGYEVRRQTVLRKSAFNPDKTGLMYSSDNTSPGRNTYLGVQQTFSFPTLYISQGKLQNQEVQSSKISLDVSRLELVKNVRLVYNRLTYDNTRLRVLTDQDSTYSGFAKAAEVRYKSGETTLLEKVTADARFRDVQLQEKQAEADLVIDRREFQKLLNTKQDYIVIGGLEKQDFSTGNDSMVEKENPVLIFYRQNINIAKAKLSLEKNRLLPDFTVGYNAQTVNGAAGYYGYEAGINIPVWFRAGQGKIQASRLDLQIANSDYENVLNDFLSGYDQEKSTLDKWREQVNYYENIGLKQAETILNTAVENYRSGNISYVEYIQDVSEAFNIRLRYLDDLAEYNRSIVNIKYYLGE